MKTQALADHHGPERLDTTKLLTDTRVQVRACFHDAMCIPLHLRLRLRLILQAQIRLHVHLKL